MVDLTLVVNSEIWKERCNAEHIAVKRHDDFMKTF